MTNTEAKKSTSNASGKISKTSPKQNNTPMPIKDKSEYKIYINESWYIPVNSNGYCSGAYYEGALGVIIQIKNQNGGIYALKLPRQLADTLKENAYICELLREEKSNLEKIFTREGEIGRDALLRGGFLSEKIFQSPVESKNSSCEEARQQHNQIIAVQFSKGKPPRFCSIIPNDSDTFLLYPTEIKKSDFPLVKSSDLSKIQTLAKKDDVPWEKSVVLYDLPKDSNKSNISILNDFLLEDSSYSNLWYVCLPGIVYEWGKMTLTETINSRKNSSWTLSQYLSLTKVILSGVNALHNRQIVHADIRPANIMCVGAPDNPTHYKLIDYGSFNQYDQEYSTKKILGPTLGRERISPFYSNERKNITERENCDTAIFFNSKESDKMVVVLGWRNSLIQNDKIKEDVISEIQNLKFPSQSKDSVNFEYDQNLLIPGDKIQIRKYIFHIADITFSKSGNTVLLCNKNYWKIFHGKIITACEDKIENEYWISISSTIELRQWSYATDMYSVGAILIYTLFWGGNDLSKRNLIESEFITMLDELNSVPFFKNMWMDLSPLCAQIDSFYNDDSSLKEIASFVFNPESYLDIQTESKNSSINQERDKTFTEYAKYITFLITSSVKGTRKILKLLNFNYIYFIYIVHFALCCLHRKSSLKIQESDSPQSTDGELKFANHNLVYPFCDDRANNKELKNLAVSESIKYIENFIQILNSKKFESFQLSEAERERNKPQYIPATELRRRFAELNDKQALLKKDLDIIIKQNKDLEYKKNAYRDELTDIKRIHKKQEDKYAVLQENLTEILNINNFIKSEIKKIIKVTKPNMLGGYDKETMGGIMSLIDQIKE